MRLDQQLSSATAEEGQPVALVVAEEIKIGDTVVIPEGASVKGTVVQAVPKRRMGRTGKLDFSIDTLLMPDGGKIPLRYQIQKKEGGSHAVRTGVITAGVAVVFWPAAPFMLLMKGKDTTYNKGMALDVFTDSKYTLKPAAAAAPPASAVAAAAAEKTAVSFTSDPPGADIEIDGGFVGSTPSTVSLGPGKYAVKISKGSKVWERSVLVRAGSTQNINATLEEKPQ